VQRQPVGNAQTSHRILIADSRTDIASGTTIRSDGVVLVAVPDRCSITGNTSKDRA
jgi:hypothetical protein